jgi:hypothetical protein
MRKALEIHVEEGAHSIDHARLELRNHLEPTLTKFL